MSITLPLTCPCKIKSKIRKTETGYICCEDGCEHSVKDNEFAVSNEIPILISETRCDTVCVSRADQTYISRPLAGYSGLKKLIVGESKVTKTNCKLFVEELFSRNKNPKVLVVGSGKRALARKNYG